MSSVTNTSSFTASSSYKSLTEPSTDAPQTTTTTVRSDTPVAVEMRPTVCAAAPFSDAKEPIAVKEKSKGDKSSFKPKDPYEKRQDELTKSVSNRYDAARNVPKPAEGDPIRFVERFKQILGDPLTPRMTSEESFRTLTNYFKPATPDSMEKPIITTRAWYDLGILPGQQDKVDEILSSRLLEEPHKPHTMFGQNFFLMRLANPTNDVTKLKNRQEATKAFASEEALRASFEERMKTLAQHEAYALKPSDSKTALPGTANNKYWKRAGAETLNNNRYSLEVGSVYETSKKVTGLISQTALTLLAPAAIISKIFWPSDPASDTLKNQARHYIGAAGPHFSIATSIADATEFNNTELGCLLLGSLSSASALKSSFKWFKADWKCENFLQELMYSVATYYRNMKWMYTTLQDYPHIKDRLEHYQILENFFNNPKLETLFSTLDTHTFDEKGPLFYNNGNVLLAWHLLQEPEIRDEFEKAMIAVGEIDTILTNVKLMQTSKGPWCYPEYTSELELNLKNFWNPSVINKPVLNSIKMGKENPSHIVLAGANASGKSKSGVGIGICVNTALSLGIIPAEEGVVPQLDKVETIKNIADTPGKSLFQEQSFAVDKSIANLQKAKCGLLIADEPYSGTNIEDQEALSIGLLETIADKPKDNFLSITITHIEDVQNHALKFLDNKRFANYRCPLSHGLSTYKLEPGISTDKYAIQTAKEQGGNQFIIEKAEKYKLFKEKIKVIESAKPQDIDAQKSAASEELKKAMHSSEVALTVAGAPKETN